MPALRAPPAGSIAGDTRGPKARPGVIQKRKIVSRSTRWQTLDPERPSSLVRASLCLSVPICRSRKELSQAYCVPQCRIKALCVRAQGHTQSHSKREARRFGLSRERIVAIRVQNGNIQRVSRLLDIFPDTLEIDSFIPEIGLQLDVDISGTR